jgi:FdhE protein
MGVAGFAARKGGQDVPLEVEDLLTIHLDLLATREGFERVE